MSIERLARELEELRARVSRVEARLDLALPDESDPDTLPGVGGQRSETPLLDVLGDVIFGEEKG
jgi:hypothetical protein